MDRGSRYKLGASNGPQLLNQPRSPRRELLVETRNKHAIKVRVQTIGRIFKSRRAGHKVVQIFAQIEQLIRMALPKTAALQEVSNVWRS